MPISVLTGEGMPALIEQVAAKLTAGHRRYHLVLDAAPSAAWLHAHGEVLDQTSEEEGVRYEVRLAPADYERFMRRGV
jgi:GTP-binding protein HflX